MRFPIEEYLTPVSAKTVADGYTVIDEPITRALPHKIQLPDDVNLVVVVPSGLANTWSDAEPTLELTSSTDERLPYSDGGEPYAASLDRPPARLFVRKGKRLRASIALTVGATAVVDIEGDGKGALLEIHILGWDLRCGSMRDAGDYGSRIAIAWKRVDKAVMKFSTPPVNPYLLPRLAPLFRMKSLLGLQLPKVMARFSVRQARMKLGRTK